MSRSSTASARSSSSTARRPTSSRAAAKRWPATSRSCAWPPGRYVLDGELVIRDAEGELEFDALQSRIHPAERRIKLLAKEIPANYVVFDLLAEDDEALLERPLAERRGGWRPLAGGRGLS